MSTCSRTIQEHIKKPLAEELLFGKLAKGGVVRVKMKDGKIACTYPRPSGPTPPAKRRKGPVPAAVD